MQAESNTIDVYMARLAEGDRQVFVRVFETLWPPIHRLCTSLLRNEADASDAAQEAMSKILERASDYNKERPALPWAMAIAAWECRTLTRRRARRREDGEPKVDHGGSHAEEEFVQRDLIAAAVATLGALSPFDRETLIAAFWEEAASVSGAKLRKRRERALGRLRATFWRTYALD